MQQKSRAIKVLTWLLENIVPLQRNNKVENSTATYLRWALCWRNEWHPVSHDYSRRERYKGRIDNFSSCISSLITGKSHRFPPLGETGQKVYSQRKGTAVWPRDAHPKPSFSIFIILHLFTLTFAMTAAAMAIVEGNGGKKGISLD
jgi:hypothetical protein